MSTLAKYNTEESIRDLYPPLHNRNETRLVVVQSSEDGSTISCTLKTVNLGSCPIFEALSWVWGQDAQSAPICLNGRPWRVPVNLHDALSCLRRTDRSRTIWIDALSINQGLYEAALAERSKQIRLMRYIYSFASHVVIWMGLPPVTVSSSCLAKLESGEWMEDMKNECSPSSPSYPGDDIPGSPGACEDMIFKILYNAWWSRVWTLQESILSEKSSIQLGTAATSFHYFLEGVEDLFQNYPKSTLNKARWFYNSSVNLRKWQLLQSAGKSRQLPDPQTSSHYLHNAKGDWYRLAQILVACRHQLATDPRDKIYGFLGLVDEAVADVIGPDYAEELADAYTRITSLIAVRGHSLLFLTAADATLKDRSVLGLPSWVPDWSTVFDVNEQDQHKRYAAWRTEVVSDVQEVDVTISSPVGCPKHLQVQGIIIDDVEFVCNKLVCERNLNSSSLVRLKAAHAQRSDQSLKRPLQWLKKTARVVMPKSHPVEDSELGLTSRVHEKPFLKACLEAMERGHDPETYEIGSKFAGMLAGPQFRTLDQIYDELYHTSQHPSLNKRGTCMILAQNGLLGSCSQARVGDVIAWLRGSPLPTVLRPVAGSLDQYLFISECCIKGITDGSSAFTFSKAARHLERNRVALATRSDFRSYVETIILV